VHYEELLLTPHTVLHRLCDWLGLEFSPGLAEGPLPAQDWELGDERVRRRETIDAGNAERWQAALRDPQVWRLCRNYRDLLGSGVLDGLGYASSGLDQILRAAQPAPSRLSLTYSWEALVAPRRAPRKALLRARRVLQRALLPRK
jgi:hypothetical protein